MKGSKHHYKNSAADNVIEKLPHGAKSFVVLFTNCEGINYATFQNDRNAIFLALCLYRTFIKLVSRCDIRLTVKKKEYVYID